MGRFQFYLVFQSVFDKKLFLAAHLLFYASSNFIYPPLPKGIIQLWFPLKEKPTYLSIIFSDTWDFLVKNQGKKDYLYGGECTSTSLLTIKYPLIKKTHNLDNNKQLWIVIYKNFKLLACWYKKMWLEDLILKREKSTSTSTFHEIYQPDKLTKKQLSFCKGKKLHRYPHYSVLMSIPL